MLENFRLRVFRTVAEESSFRRASEVLNLSQPAVSQQVQALEQELGTALFDRSENRVRLTEQGKLLLRHAKRAAQLACEAEEALLAHRGQIAGELRVGASTTVAQYVLPEMLGRFHQHHPRVSVSMISGNTEWVVEALVRGEIQLGIIEGPVSSREVHKQALLQDRMTLIVPLNHVWSEVNSIRLEDLTSMPLLMRERGSGSRRVVEATFKRAGLRLKNLNVIMELDSTGAIIAGVEAGLGVGFVSRRAIIKELRLDTLKAVDVQGLEIRRAFTLIRRAGPAPSGAAGAFEEFAAAEVRRSSH